MLLHPDSTKDAKTTPKDKVFKFTISGLYACTAQYFQKIVFHPRPLVMFIPPSAISPREPSVPHQGHA
jgi:hypothetical protein